MSITTAAELKTALANWTNYDDLTARLDEFIALFEAKFNREVRVRGMEAAMASTALASGAISNPSNFLAWKELRYDGAPNYALTPKPLQWIRDQPDLADKPLHFAVADTQTVAWPQSGSLKGTYYRSLPSLTGTSTNWLLTAHPDIYLFGCLEQAAFYEDDPRGERWGGRAAQLIEQLISSDEGNELNGGPLVARAR